MKRKLIGVAALLVVSALSFAGTKTTYMMVPSNTQVIYPDESGAKRYVHLMAMDSNGDEITSDDIAVTKSEFYKDDNPDEVHADLYKITVTSPTDDMKLVAGYKIQSKDKYIILSADNADGVALQSNYEDFDFVNDPPTPVEVLGIVSIDDYSNYNDFPGHVVEDQTLLTVVRAGEKISKDQEKILEDQEDTSSVPNEAQLSEPSNIIEKLYQPPTEGDQITLGAGSKILPTNSFKNYEFTVVDVNGDPVILMKNEGDEYSNNLNNNFVDDKGVIDLKKLDSHLDKTMGDLTLTENGNIVIFSSDENDSSLGPYTIRVHFKGGIHNVPAIVNGEPYTFDKVSFTVNKFRIIYGGSGNEFWLDVDEDGVTFPEDGGRPGDIPPKPSGPAVYLVEAHGMVMDGEAIVKSQTDDSGKQRISDVDIKIMESGMSGYEVKKIEKKGKSE